MIFFTFGGNIKGLAVLTEKTQTPIIIEKAAYIGTKLPVGLIGIVLF
jgi:hypothetical protein